MIFCVVPEPLEGELFPKLVDYYADDPNVTVIVDRRKGTRRLPSSAGTPAGVRTQRELRDRRRRRPGDFAPLATGD